MFHNNCIRTTFCLASLCITTLSIIKSQCIHINTEIRTSLSKLFTAFPFSHILFVTVLRSLLGNNPEFKKYVFPWILGRNDQQSYNLYKWDVVQVKTLHYNKIKINDPLHNCKCYECYVNDIGNRCPALMRNSNFRIRNMLFQPDLTGKRNYFAFCRKFIQFHSKHIHFVCLP